MNTGLLASINGPHGYWSVSQLQSCVYCMSLHHRTLMKSLICRCSSWFNFKLEDFPLPFWHDISTTLSRKAAERCPWRSVKVRGCLRRIWSAEAWISNGFRLQRLRDSAERLCQWRSEPSAGLGCSAGDLQRSTGPGVGRRTQRSTGWFSCWCWKIAGTCGNYD